MLRLRCLLFYCYKQYSDKFKKQKQEINRHNIGEGIKGLILWRCGKQNSTHPGELRQPQIVHCIIAAAAIKERQSTR